MLESLLETIVRKRGEMGCTASKNEDGAEMSSIVVGIQDCRSSRPLRPAKSRKTCKKKIGMKMEMQICFRNKKKKKDKLNQIQPRKGGLEERMALLLETKVLFDTLK